MTTPLLSSQEQSGNLIVANSLTAERNSNTFIVEVVAFDLGVPSLSATATVTVAIQRNLPPTFPSNSVTVPAIREDLNPSDNRCDSILID